MSVDALRQEFGIDGAVCFEQIEGELIVARLQNEQGRATVALHGAHLLEFCPANGKPVLWVSKQSKFEAGKAIRGGIPICWPWFCEHTSDEFLPFHGFARISDWEVVQTAVEDDGSTSICLQLPFTPANEQMWPHPFSLELRVNVSDKLKVELEMCNAAEVDVTFSCALHTYFAVSDVESISIKGLDGCHYLDTTQEPNVHAEQSGAINISSEVDRVYLDTDATCFIEDPGWNRRITVNKSGSRSTVVWNPWYERASEMVDFGDDEYCGMICVETTNAHGDARVLGPQESHILKAVIETESLDR